MLVIYTGVAILGLLGFGLHTGPVYTGDAVAAGPASWIGIASLALLLAGLLAVPARVTDGAHYRIPVAVLSGFGLLVAVMGLLDRPAGAGIGWAAVLLTVLSAVQTALALLALTAQPAAAAIEGRRQPHAPSPDPHAPAATAYRSSTAFAVPVEPVHGTAFGQGTGINTAQATPPPSPAPSPVARGAQPSAGPAQGPQPTWGVHGQSRPAADPVDQPVRNVWPM